MTLTLRDLIALGVVLIVTDLISDSVTAWISQRTDRTRRERMLAGVRERIAAVRNERRRAPQPEGGVDAAQPKR